MLGWLMVTSLQFVAAIGALMIVLYITGANLYDIQTMRRTHQQRRQAKRSHNRRPRVTVIIYAHNDERTISRCIESVLASSYRFLEIIVADNASTDTTKRVTRSLLTQTPAANTILYAKQRPTIRASIISEAYHRHGSGDYIMQLNASDVLHKQAIKRAIIYFEQDLRIGAIYPSIYVRPAASLSSLLQRYQSFLGIAVQKFNSISNSEYLYREQVMVPRRYFTDVQNNQVKKFSTGFKSRYRSYYAGDVIVQIEPDKNMFELLTRMVRVQINYIHSLYTKRQLFFKTNPEYSRFLTWFRLPLAVCLGLCSLIVPIIIGYFIFLAIFLKQPSLLALSGSVFTLMLLYAIWGDRDLSFFRKLGFSIGIPITYIMYILFSVMPYIAFSGYLGSFRGKGALTPRVI